MKYTICSLAVGKRYLDNITETFKKISSITPVPNFIAATDLECNSEDRISFVNIGETPYMTQDGRFFNYNLKFYPIKEATKTDTNFIVYIDSDWNALDTYSDDKFTRLFNVMDESNLDFVFERPHPIGPGKHVGRECFWQHKVAPYKLTETDKYDNAHVCNEQIFIIKNTEKAKKFCSFWEECFWKSYNENIWGFAEGVEIGMSTIEAGFNVDWRPITILNQCFSFYSRDGGYNTRF